MTTQKAKGAITLAIEALEQAAYFKTNGFVRANISEALTSLRALVADVPELGAALRNAVAPVDHFHTTCPKCRHDFHANNGEWLLWCGDKKHAAAILKAATILATATKGEWMGRGKFSDNERLLSALHTDMGNRNPDQHRLIWAAAENWYRHVEQLRKTQEYLVKS